MKNDSRFLDGGTFTTAGKDQKKENVWGWSEIESSLGACLRCQLYAQWDWLNGKFYM